MKKIVTIVLILFFLQMQNVLAQDTIKSTFNPNQSNVNYLNKMKIKIFYTLTPSHNPRGNGEIYKINIYNKNGRLKQVIKNPGIIFDPSMLVQEVDVNFDKYLDFGIYTNERGADEAMNYYVFNPKTQKFLFNKTLSDIIKPTIDAKNNCIISYERVREGYYCSGIHKWIKGKLTLVSYRETINSGNGMMIIKDYEIKNGKIILEK